MSKWRAYLNTNNTLINVYKDEATKCTTEQRDFVVKRLNMQTPTGITRDETLDWLDGYIDGLRKSDDWAAVTLIIEDLKEFRDRIDGMNT